MYPIEGFEPTNNMQSIRKSKKKKKLWKKSQRSSL